MRLTNWLNQWNARLIQAFASQHQRRTASPERTRHDDAHFSLESLETRLLLTLPDAFDIAQLEPDHGGDGTFGFVVDDPRINYGATSIASAGDLNHDGYDDLVIGDPTANDSAGIVYVLFGRATYSGGAIDLSHLDGTNGFKLLGIAGEQLGANVATNGDFNGDGVADLLITASGALNGRGRAYVIKGHGGSFAANATPNDSYASLGYSITSSYTHSRYWADGSGPSQIRNVQFAGDLNRDGSDEVLILQPHPHSSRFSYDGSDDILVFGKGRVTRDIDLNEPSIDSVVSVLFSTDYYSYPVTISAPLGDINGNGSADLLLTNNRIVDGIAFPNGGRIELHPLNSVALQTPNISLSDASPHPVDDFNGDGFDDFVTTSGIRFGGTNTVIDNGRTIELQGFDINNSRYAGNGQPLGDFDGDGLADVTFGSQLVLFGTRDSLPASVDLNYETPIRMLVRGGSIRPGGGDLNHDGRADLVFTNANEIGVLFGTQNLPERLPTYRDADQLVGIRRRLEEVGIDGATIIVHGFQLANDGGDSLKPLADSIVARMGGWLLNDDLASDGGQAHLTLIPGQPRDGHELVLLFDWAPESNEPSAGWTEGAGDALFSLVTELGLVDLVQHTAVPLHFIGHSFGAAVASEAVERLAAYQIPVDQVTYLDPHDFDQGFWVDGQQRQSEVGAPEGYGAAVWNNVAFADAYFQTRGQSILSNPVAVPEGRAIPGAYNEWLSPPAAPAYGSYSDHAWVWNSWYQSTVNSDEFDGYQFSHLAGASDSGLAAARPAPNFLSLDADAYEHTPTDFLPSAFGPDGTNSLGYTRDEVNDGGWTPEWSSFSQLHHGGNIFNGDFDDAGDVVNISSFQSNLIPGWSHHGGGGAGLIGRDGPNNFLKLTGVAPDRTHNWSVIPPNAAFLSFAARAKQIAAGDHLSLTVTPLDPSVAPLTFDVAVSQLGAAIFQTKTVALPARLQGQVVTLKFALNSSSGDRAASEVWVDDLRLHDPTAELVVSSDVLGSANNRVADEFRVSRNGEQLEVRANGNLVRSVPFNSVRRVTVTGSNDDDRLIVDFTNGSPVPADIDGTEPAFVFLAGGERTIGDQLVVIGPGGTNSSATFAPNGVRSGEGVVSITGSDNWQIGFQGIEPAPATTSRPSSGTSQNSRVQISNVDQLTMITPGGSEGLRVTKTSDNLNTISGSSGRVGFSPLVFRDVRAVLLDLQNNDSGRPSSSVTFVNDLVSRGLQDFQFLLGVGDDYVDARFVTTLALMINGAEGNDTLIGGGRADSFVGGLGNDLLSGNGAMDTLIGSEGDDTLVGGLGDDSLDGADGSDTVQETGANLTLIDSRLTGSGTDRLIGIEKASLTGTSGNNRLDASGFSGSVTLKGLAGNDTLLGSQSNDLLVGGDGDDSLSGNGGNDTIAGGKGKDSLNGGDGNDAIRGDDGNDSLVGGLGNDTLLGGAGNDTLRGGAGNDVCLGEDGADLVIGDEDTDILAGNGRRAGGADRGDRVQAESTTEILAGLFSDLLPWANLLY